MLLRALLVLCWLAASAAAHQGVPLPDYARMNNDCSGRGPGGVEGKAALCMREFALSHFTGNASSTLWSSYGGWMLSSITPGNVRRRDYYHPRKKRKAPGCESLQTL